MIDNNILTLDDVEVKGKRVLIRCDINSPINPETKKIEDDTRIRRSLPSLKELSEREAKVTILAHQGDPLDYQNFTSLFEHAEYLSKYLNKEVRFVEDTVGPTALKMIRNLEKGQLLLLQNVRIHTEETIIFEEEAKLTPEEQSKTYLVSKLAPLGDLYVCDAFAAVHRSQPTLVGLPEVLPSVAGRLFEEELTTLTKIVRKPERPCLFLLGGAKILDAFKMMKQVLQENVADQILTSGLVGQIILLARRYSLGEKTENFLKERGLLKYVRNAKQIMKKFPSKVQSPKDLAIQQNNSRKEFAVRDLPVDGLICDIGRKTIEEYTKKIDQAGTVFVNGPTGVYEKELFSLGTEMILKSVGSSSAFSVIGGGDSIAASQKFGVIDQISYICTAGGGLIRFLSGETLPVIAALKKSAEE